MENYEHVTHGFAPVYDENSEVLILGSFPSVKSREGSFYYHHKQNRFWRLLAELTNDKIPETVDDKKKLILKNHLALWDVIESCDIIGSSDASIKNVCVTDIRKIIGSCRIKRIILNGKAAGRLFEKYQLSMLENIDYVILPSTSPANAACSFEQLMAEWGKYLGKC